MEGSHMKISTKLFLAAFLITVLGFSQFANPQLAQAACSGVVYVSLTGNNTTGCSWGNAFTTLQSALSIATSGDQVWVASGTYYPDEGTGQTNNNRNSTFRVIAGVKVY